MVELQNLQLDPAFGDWLDRHGGLGRHKKTLVRLNNLLSCLIAHPEYCPSKHDLEWVEKVRSYYLDEEPDWMKP
jgi:hypothetical protein